MHLNIPCKIRIKAYSITVMNRRPFNQSSTSCYIIYLRICKFNINSTVLTVFLAHVCKFNTFNDNLSSLVNFFFWVFRVYLYPMVDKESSA